MKAAGGGSAGWALGFLALSMGPFSPMDAENPSGPELRDRAYARAREGESDGTTEVLLEHAFCFGGSVDEFRELARMLRRYGNHITWKRLMARRTAAIGVTVRRIVALLGNHYVCRFKDRTRTRWTIVGRGLDGENYVVAVVSAATPRTFEQLARPVSVRLLHPMLDEHALRRSCSRPPHTAIPPRLAEPTGP